VSSKTLETELFTVICFFKIFPISAGIIHSTWLVVLIAPSEQEHTVAKKRLCHVIIFTRLYVLSSRL
jgi:hypothetical protein